ncbi:hypothetical protein FACS189425_01710 [Clostridia bacterium]|nr:hypothetical protein FACS189425_01710 [Clostridia bacterium]
MFFDFLLVAIFALALLRGWRKGFITMAFGAASLIIALVISFSMRESITKFAMTLPFAQKISEAIAKSAHDFSGGLANLPFVSSALDSQANTLTYTIVQVLSIIAVFVVVFVVLGLLSKFLNSLIRFVHLNFINRIAGLAIGIINGYILMCLFSMLFFALGAIVPQLNGFMTNSFLAHNLPSPLKLLNGLHV